MKDNLTDYELSCGNAQNIILEEDSYHVRCFKKVKNSSSCDRISWKVFENLKYAREYWNKTVKFYK